jgi:hypothetical protein
MDLLGDVSNCEVEWVGAFISKGYYLGFIGRDDDRKDCVTWFIFLEFLLNYVKCGTLEVGLINVV